MVLTVTVGPPAPPVVPPPVEAKPSGVPDQVRPPPPPPPPPVTGLKAHCLLVLAVHVSWMIAAPDAVEASLSLAHRPLCTLMIWKVLVPLATSRQSWLLRAGPQGYCRSRTPDAVEAPGT